MSPEHSIFTGNRETCLKAREEGAAIVAVLSVLALLSLLLVSLLYSARVERTAAAESASAEQSELAAKSGISSALTLLMIATSHSPAYLVGLKENDDAAADSSLDITPTLVIGATNLSNPSQMLPLFSSDLKSLAAFPKIPSGQLDFLLEKRLSTNPAVAIDLNDPALIGSSGALPSQKSATGGIIDTKGHFPALWQTIKDSNGDPVGRFAFIMTDESARLNPALHLGQPRNDPADWDNGPQDIPLSNGNPELPSLEEALHLKDVALNLPTEASFERSFQDPSGYNQKRSLLTRDACQAPDLIPASLPEGGLPKYNLNDLATNHAWGVTPYDRALTIASVIGRNLPKFQQRDAALSAKGADQALYLRRIACSIVDYISPEVGPTGPPGGEPSGRDLVPYVTQIAERCTLTDLSSNSATIESQFFVEIWNPSTGTIQGGTPRLLIGNRARVLFGTAIESPFRDYEETGAEFTPLRPNEFTVVAFKPETQRWDSPTVTASAPKWERGPGGNANNTRHQNFRFYWNDRLVDMTRAGGLSVGDSPGGLDHYGQTLNDRKPHWQILTSPTYAAGSSSQAEADEALEPGSYRFVGDPRANFLTAYTWSAVTDYQAKTRWKGVNPAEYHNLGYVLDPMKIWRGRDRVPLDGPAGNMPETTTQNPDTIPSPYREERDGITAPFVLRKGAMTSLAELGNIFDPAQVDDQGQAPKAGAASSSFCCGGGRTLRIGQPEFQFPGTNYNWNVPGKRAIELLDLFTLTDEGRKPGASMLGTNAGVPGRININTAPHPVLTALFSGISVSSDRRFTNSIIGVKAADALATLLEEHRPYSRLSDLSILTTNLVNAETYTPPLSQNIIGSAPPSADIFDRAREEALGKIAGHCILQTRVFHLYVLGESLDRRGKPTGQSLMEGMVRLKPDSKGRLIPTLHDVQWR